MILADLVDRLLPLRQFLVEERHVAKPSHSRYVGHVT